MLYKVFFLSKFHFYLIQVPKWSDRRDKFVRIEIEEINYLSGHILVTKAEFSVNKFMLHKI
jgi:hypothetical protein